MPTLCSAATVACAFVLLVALALSSAAANPPLSGAVLFGYQGWFTAAGDLFPKTPRWRHWSKNITALPSPGNLVFEMYPDLSEYPSNALFSTNLSFPNGSKAKVCAFAPSLFNFELPFIYCNNYRS